MVHGQYGGYSILLPALEQSLQSADVHTLVMELIDTQLTEKLG